MQKARAAGEKAPHASREHMGKGHDCEWERKKSPWFSQEQPGVCHRNNSFYYGAAGDRHSGGMGFGNGHRMSLEAFMPLS
jgi:hypothetical protein